MTQPISRFAKLDVAFLQQEERSLITVRMNETMSIRTLHERHRFGSPETPERTRRGTESMTHAVVLTR